MFLFKRKSLCHPPKDMRNAGEEHAPQSDAELLGHELKHAEHQDFNKPDSEDLATQEIDAILSTPKDMNQKEAGQFVDDLLKENPDDSDPHKKRQDDCAALPAGCPGTAGQIQWPNPK